MPPAGATACSGCHAALPLRTLIPPLDGRDAGGIAEAMRDFRTGARPATVMDRIAKGFTEDETRLIAQWLEQRPAGGRP